MDRANEKWKDNMPVYHGASYPGLICIYLPGALPMKLIIWFYRNIIYSGQPKDLETLTDISHNIILNLL